MRQLALHAFAEVNNAELEYPRVKIAMIMRAYRKEPNNTWCPFPEPRWASWTKVSTMHKLEALLRYFQVTCKPAVAGMQALKRVQLTANVAVAAADAFIMCKEREKEGDAMLSAVAKYFDEIKLFAEKRGGIPPKPEEAWFDFDEMRKRNTDKSAVADKEPEQFLPKVIMCDQVLGMPINAQDVRAATATGQAANIAIAPWDEWFR